LDRQEVSIDASRWPVVQITCAAHVGLSSIRRMARSLDELHRMRGAMLLVCDIDGLKPSVVTPLLRKELAEEADKLAERGAFLAEAIVVRDPILRALYRAYTWVRQKCDYPTEVFTDTESARRWLRTQAQPPVRASTRASST
jgi:hypothetical protein